jgi:hypothetical protein
MSELKVAFSNSNAKIIKPIIVMKLSIKRWETILPLIRVLLRAKSKEAAKLLKIKIKSTKLLDESYPTLFALESTIMKKAPKKADANPMISHLWTSFLSIYISGTMNIPCKFVRANAWLYIVLLDPQILKLCHTICKTAVNIVKLIKFRLKLFGLIYDLRSKKLKAVLIELIVEFEFLFDSFMSVVLKYSYSFKF